MSTATVEQIYALLPIPLQNLVVSLYGYRLAKLQRGGQYRKYLAEITLHTGMGRNELLSLQLNILRELVSVCENRVPYYRHIFRKHEFSADKLKSLDDLRRIPLLEKEPLRQNPRRFVNEQYQFSKLSCINTSGSTGTPLKIYFDPAARQLNYAFFDRFLSMATIPYRGRKATFGGRLIVPNRQNKPPFWRMNYFQKNMMFSTYHMKPDNMHSYIQQLKAWAPDFIDAYPSSIASLARFVIDNNIDGKEMTRAIVTSAETLRTDQRSAIESAFDAPVVDQYGSVEMAAFIGQCTKGRYHIHMDYGFIEFLRPDGAAAKHGEEAEIVCTGFVNKAMPLVRYRIGDRCITSDEPCKCGLQFPVIEKIIGRMDDVVLTPDGRSVSRFGAVLYGLPVKEVQYEQRIVDKLIVKIVRDSQYTEETEAIIKKRLRKRLGNEILIAFDYVDKIDRGPGGKLKTIVSKVVHLSPVN